MLIPTAKQVFTARLTATVSLVELLSYLAEAFLQRNSLDTGHWGAGRRGLLVKGCLLVDCGHWDRTQYLLPRWKPPSHYTNLPLGLWYRPILLFVSFYKYLSLHLVEIKQLLDGTGLYVNTKTWEGSVIRGLCFFTTLVSSHSHQWKDTSSARECPRLGYFGRTWPLPSTSGTGTLLGNDPTKGLVIPWHPLSALYCYKAWLIFRIESLE